jgi:hypothetical protein
VTAGARDAALAGVAVVLLALGAIAVILLSSGSSDPSAVPAPTSSAERPTQAAPPPSASPSTPAPAGSPASPRAGERPAAVGTGRPECTGPCVVEHRLTRSFLPSVDSEQTLLLARSEESDQDGNNLHAFLVDDDGLVLWEEHGFGWTWQRVDDRFAIRFDEAGNVFFRSYVADFTFLYVLHTGSGEPRLVGSPGRDPGDGFQGGQVDERPGRAAFDVLEQVVDCPPGEQTVLECPFHMERYRWNGEEYVRA